MNNNKNKDNSLIKRKNLIFELKKAGISGINKEALILIEDLLKNNLIHLAENLKQEIIIKGRKILKKEDIINTIKKSNSNSTSYSNWEI